MEFHVIELPKHLNLTILECKQGINVRDYGLDLI